jgi:hypothetical protein
MELIKQFYKVLNEKKDKTGRELNKIIFFNMIMTLSAENNLTETEREALTMSATLINELYK